MTYEEFIDRVKSTIHEEIGYSYDMMKFYPEGMTSDDPKVSALIKDSNIRYVGKESTQMLTDILIIEVPDDDNSATIHRIATRAMYENAEKNGFETAFDDIRNMQDELESVNMDPKKVAVRATTEYDEIREQLILRPLNFRLHAADLRGCVYRRVSDFAIVLYQLIGESNQTLMTSKIKQEEVVRWGMEGQEDQVFKDALENTARLYPACVFDQRTGQEENFLARKFTKKDIAVHAFNDLITLSTFRTTNGAMALFYPGVVEKMMEIMGGPFQAVFMNTNDVMIFDKNDRLASQFAQTAKKSSQLGEMLSGKIMLCDGKPLLPGIV